MIAIRVKKLWLHDMQSLPHYRPFARESTSDPKSPHKDPVINNVDIVFVIGWKLWTSIAGMNLPSDVPGNVVHTQAIIWANVGILLNGPMGNIREILIEIRIFSFRKMRLKMSAKRRPFCFSLNVLSFRKSSQAGQIRFEMSVRTINPTKQTIWICTFHISRLLMSITYKMSHMLCWYLAVNVPVPISGILFVVACVAYCEHSDWHIDN